MMQDRGRPINEVPFDEVKEREKEIEGWIYPRRNISPCTNLFRTPQKLAIAFWGWTAIIMFLLSIPLWIMMDSTLWLLLIPSSIVLWKVNRGTVESFFIENLKKERQFYEHLQITFLGDQVRVIFQGDP